MVIKLKHSIKQCVALLQANQVKDYVYWEPNYLVLPVGKHAYPTIHDLSHIRMPEHHPRERVELLNQKLMESIRKAYRIITVSEFSKREIQTLLGVDSSRIAIVTPAVNHPSTLPSNDKVLMIREKYQLPESYILSLCTIEPRKNLERLFKAFSALPDDLQRQFPLIHIGVSGWKSHGLDDLIEQLPNVRKLGYVMDEDLAAILSGATIMAYPTLYEGFGMPVLEAMALGVPVLTSEGGATEEVAGDAACLVNPHSLESIHSGLLKLITDQEYRGSLSRKGLQRSRKYSWDYSAEQLIDLLRASS